MTLNQRIVGGAIALILLGAALVGLAMWVNKARTAIAQNELRGEAAEATAGNIETGAVVAGEVAAVTATTTEAASVYHQSKEEEERHVPTARDRNARAVPNSVRERARARRIARERLESDG